MKVVILSTVSYLLISIELVKGTKENLPKIFHLDNYDLCLNNDNLYCKVTLNLRVKKGFESFCQKYFGYSRQDDHNYKAHYGLCIPSKNESKPENLFIGAFNKVNENKYFSVTVDEHMCAAKWKWNYNPYDIFLGLFLISYFSVVFYATWLDSRWTRFPSRCTFTSKTKEAIRAFSITENWRHLIAEENSKTPYIQGVRVFTMLKIIATHTSLAYLSMFLENPESINQKCSNIFLQVILAEGMALVHTFFFISGFLLSQQVIRLTELNKGLTFQDILLILLNRCLRLLPVVVIVILVTGSKLYRLLLDGVNIFVVDRESRNCNQSWWRNIFFISNLYGQPKSCCGGGWYISADTQMYFMSLAVLYIIFKIRRFTNFILLTCLGLVLVNQGWTIYSNGLEATYRMTAHNARLDTIYASDAFLLYFHTKANLASYLLGIVFAFYYHSKKEKKELVSKTTWIFSIVLYIAVLIAKSIKITGLSAAIVGPLLKPSYALASGIWIFGLMSGYGGFLRSIYACHVIQVLAKITYSTYVFHFGVVFLKLITTKELVNYSLNEVALSYPQDVIMAIMFGAFMHMTVERPFSVLQKLYVPQVKKAKSGTEKKL